MAVAYQLTGELSFMGRAKIITGDLTLFPEKERDLYLPNRFMVGELEKTPEMKKGNIRFLKMLRILEMRALDNQNGFCRTTNKQLMALIGVTEPTINTWMKELEAYGYLTRFTTNKIVRHAKTNEYSQLRIIRMTRVFRYFGLGYGCKKTRKLYELLEETAFSVYRHVHPLLARRITQETGVVSRLYDKDWYDSEVGEMKALISCRDEQGVLLEILGPAPFGDKVARPFVSFEESEIIQEDLRRYGMDPESIHYTVDMFLDDEMKDRIWRSPRWVNLMKHYINTKKNIEDPEDAFREIREGLEYEDYMAPKDKRFPFEVKQHMTDAEILQAMDNGLLACDIVAIVKGEKELDRRYLDPDFKKPIPKTEEQLVAEREALFAEVARQRAYKEKFDNSPEMQQIAEDYMKGKYLKPDYPTPLEIEVPIQWRNPIGAWRKAHPNPKDPTGAVVPIYFDSLHFSDAELSLDGDYVFARFTLPAGVPSFHLWPMVTTQKNPDGTSEIFSIELVKYRTNLDILPSIQEFYYGFHSDDDDVVPEWAAKWSERAGQEIKYAFPKEGRLPVGG